VATADTARAVRALPRDRAVARGVACALLGLPWIVRERRANPPHVEAMLRRVDEQPSA
jgi:hypothetical protein